MIHVTGYQHVTLLQVGQAMYKKAGELGLPVGHMPFKGLLLHINVEPILQAMCDTHRDASSS
jgi:hypothetical protein